MIFCDITLSYNEKSGGIRTYIDEKRNYLLRETDHEHLLIVPADEDAVDRDGRATTVRVASPFIPGFEPYRMFWRPEKLGKLLKDFHPEVVELGSFYVAPWPAFHYRDIRLPQGQKIVVGGYFHTDVADAYVGTPLKTALAEALGGWSDTLEQFGQRIAEAAEMGAASYVKSVFERCDLRLAASPAQAARLEEYGVDDVHIVPLGVDLERFHPKHRSEEARRQWGADEDDIVLMYAGRLVEEKRVGVLVDAFERLHDREDMRLVILGEGPLGEQLEPKSRNWQHFYLLPYETDPAAFARTLASADIYVTAGPHETFGLSVVEAQAAGLPVVGVDAGALTERVPEGTGFLGPVDNAAAMADNIERALKQRRALSQASRRHVEEHFSWNATFDQWLRLYDDALQT